MEREWNEDGKVFLREWYVFVKLSRMQVNVLVRGRREREPGVLDDEPWQSSPILRRLNATEVFTRRGSCYALEGPMSEKAARKAGVSEDVIALFREGFPDEWKRAISELGRRWQKSYEQIHGTPKPLTQKSQNGVARLLPAQSVRDERTVGEKLVKSKTEKGTAETTQVPAKEGRRLRKAVTEAEAKANQHNKPETNVLDVESTERALRESQNDVAQKTAVAAVAEELESKNEGDRLGLEQAEGLVGSVGNERKLDEVWEAGNQLGDDNLFSQVVTSAPEQKGPDATARNPSEQEGTEETPDETVHKPKDASGAGETDGDADVGGATEVERKAIASINLASPPSTEKAKAGEAEESDSVAFDKSSTATSKKEKPVTAVPDVDPGEVSKTEHFEGAVKENSVVHGKEKGSISQDMQPSVQAEASEGHATIEVLMDNNGEKRVMAVTTFSKQIVLDSGEEVGFAATGVVTAENKENSDVPDTSDNVAEEPAEVSKPQIPALAPAATHRSTGTVEPAAGSSLLSVGIEGEAGGSSTANSDEKPIDRPDLCGKDLEDETVPGADFRDSIPGESPTLGASKPIERADSKPLMKESAAVSLQRPEELPAERAESGELPISPEPRGLNSISSSAIVEVEEKTTTTEMANTEKAIQPQPNRDNLVEGADGGNPLMQSTEATESAETESPGEPAEITIDRTVESLPFAQSAFTNSDVDRKQSRLQPQLAQAEEAVKAAQGQGAMADQAEPALEPERAEPEGQPKQAAQLEKPAQAEESDEPKQSTHLELLQQPEQPEQPGETTQSEPLKPSDSTPPLQNMEAEKVREKETLGEPFEDVELAKDPSTDLAQIEEVEPAETSWSTEPLQTAETTEFKQPSKPLVSAGDLDRIPEVGQMARPVEAWKLEKESADIRNIAVDTLRPSDAIETTEKRGSDGLVELSTAAESSVANVSKASKSLKPTVSSQPEKRMEALKSEDLAILSGSGDSSNAEAVAADAVGIPQELTIQGRNDNVIGEGKPKPSGSERVSDQRRDSALDMVSKEEAVVTDHGESTQSEDVERDLTDDERRAESAFQNIEVDSLDDDNEEILNGELTPSDSSSSSESFEEEETIDPKTGDIIDKPYSPKRSSRNKVVGAQNHLHFEEIGKAGLRSSHWTRQRPVRSSYADENEERSHRQMASSNTETKKRGRQGKKSFSGKATLVSSERLSGTQNNEIEQSLVEAAVTASKKPKKSTSAPSSLTRGGLEGIERPVRSSGRRSSSRKHKALDPEILDQDKLEEEKMSPLGNGSAVRAGNGSSGGALKKEVRTSLRSKSRGRRGRPAWNDEDNESHGQDTGRAQDQDISITRDEVDVAGGSQSASIEEENEEELNIQVIDEKDMPDDDDDTEERDVTEDDYFADENNVSDEHDISEDEGDADEDNNDPEDNNSNEESDASEGKNGYDENSNSDKSDDFDKDRASDESHDSEKNQDSDESGANEQSKFPAEENALEEEEENDFVTVESPPSEYENEAGRESRRSSPREKKSHGAAKIAPRRVSKGKPSRTRRQFPEFTGANDAVAQRSKPVQSAVLSTPPVTTRYRGKGSPLSKFDDRRTQSTKNATPIAPVRSVKRGRRSPAVNLETRHTDSSPDRTDSLPSTADRQKASRSNSDFTPQKPSATRRAPNTKGEAKQTTPSGKSTRFASRKPHADVRPAKSMTSFQRELNRLHSEVIMYGDPRNPRSNRRSRVSEGAETGGSERLSDRKPKMNSPSEEIVSRKSRRSESSRKNEELSIKRKINSDSPSEEIVPTTSRELEFSGDDEEPSVKRKLVMSKKTKPGGVSPPTKVASQRQSQVKSGKAKSKEKLVLSPVEETEFLSDAKKPRKPNIKKSNRKRKALRDETGEIVTHEREQLQKRQDVKVSRSGRLIMPVLEFWRNQTVRRGVLGVEDIEEPE